MYIDFKRAFDMLLIEHTKLFDYFKIWKFKINLHEAQKNPS